MITQIGKHIRVDNIECRDSDDFRGSQFRTLQKWHVREIVQDYYTSLTGSDISPIE